MSAAITAISKLAAVTTSPIAQATPLFSPMPERSNSPIKILAIRNNEQQGGVEHRTDYGHGEKCRCPVQL